MNTYEETRASLETYFDHTAAEAWALLTSDAQVSRIRRTVRAGRERMRDELLRHLPDDLSGARVLDAGCGVGQLSAELARRGADVLGVDIAPSLLVLARRRLPVELSHRVDFVEADMLDAGLGRFDHVVAMDSLIHYRPEDTARALARLARRTEGSILFTVAPSTPALAAMHAMGRFFPRGDRSPAIVPVEPRRLARRVAEHTDRPLLVRGRVKSGFYISQAMELGSA